MALRPKPDFDGPYWKGYNPAPWSNGWDTETDTEEQARTTAEKLLQVARERWHNQYERESFTVT